MGDGVGRPVCREEKAVDAGRGGVPLGRGPKLEKVKGREGEEEERDAPDGTRCEEQDGGRADEAYGEGDAQAERAESDSGERFGLAGEEGLEGIFGLAQQRRVAAGI